MLQEVGAIAQLDVLTPEEMLDVPEEQVVSEQWTNEDIVEQVQEEMWQDEVIEVLDDKEEEEPVAPLWSAQKVLAASLELECLFTAQPSRAFQDMLWAFPSMMDALKHLHVQSLTQCSLMSYFS
ncbi:hypothetical protein DACRYDRAFT_110971 [Dacryopinax primogenitus]|uniref:Uncharacterized protein n=1 Tax=Dacryopinax primogenitus (strain DJM 731) TaxID=1858805 RepID=M5FRY8_DACPD|nr:uncharacterized protein DACRYDRAFT_110971 [Dacryopinax primogenitus]EJT98533.1 hypothetical protein DACRYDRAFT_110971 [Dacryopinax primogenitus]